jgi:NAD(P)H-flavin reductase
MSDWHEVTVVDRHQSAANLTEVDLDTGGTPVAGSHQRAGQYVKLSLPGKGEGFFAVASAPGARGEVLELLIKGGSALADALVSLPVGAKVQSTPAQGKGFAVEAAKGRRVLLFATGSGISAVRSLIGVLLRDRPGYGHLSLYFGARTPDAFAYTAELDTWEAAGLQVIRTVSQPGASGWQGLQGYVQTHVPLEPLADASAFLCGQKGMVQGVTEALERQGLPRERIFLNF